MIGGIREALPNVTNDAIDHKYRTQNERTKGMLEFLHHPSDSFLRVARSGRYKSCIFAADSTCCNESILHQCCSTKIDNGAIPI